MFTSLPVIAGIKDLVADSPVPVVFDHFGGLEAALGLEQPGFADLLELVAQARRTSRSRRLTGLPRKRPEYADIAPFARALIAANPDRILWGSDWPHPTGVTPPGPERDGRDADEADR